MSSRRAAALLLSVTLCVGLPGAAVAASPGSGGGAAGTSAGSTATSTGPIHVMPVIGASGQGGQSAAAPVTTAGLNGIDYHGGPVIMGENGVAIYWGNSVIYSG